MTAWSSLRKRLKSGPSFKVRLKEKIIDFVNSDEGVTNPPEIIRLFNLCASMKWAHLPVAGGIYDQDPEFIDGIQLIFEAQARKAKRDADEREREAEVAKRKAKH